MNQVRRFSGSGACIVASALLVAGCGGGGGGSTAASGAGGAASSGAGGAHTAGATSSSGAGGGGDVGAASATSGSAASGPGSSTASTGAGGSGGGSPIDGCWITHTSSGETQLDLTVNGDVVTGTLTWSMNVYPLTNGLLSGGQLTFTVDWANEGFTCAYDFPSVSATALSGTSMCATNTQAITADRTCTGP